MNLGDLEKNGGFVSPQLTKIPVEWKHIIDGKESSTRFSIFLKKPSFASVERIQTAESSGKSYSIMTIAETVSFGEKGEETISYEEAARLDTSLAVTIINAINKHFAESNATQKKPMSKKKRSGMNQFLTE